MKRMYKLTDLKEKQKDLTRMIIINEKQLPESTECNTDNYQWNSQEYQIQAKEHFDNIIIAKELGLNAQIDLNTKAIFELMFKDYMEVCKIKIKKLEIIQVYYHYNRRFVYFCAAFLNEYWIGSAIYKKHKLKLFTKNILLPKESFQVLAKLQELPKGFVQEVAIFELKREWDTKCPFLAVRILNNWYSIAEW